MDPRTLSARSRSTPAVARLAPACFVLAVAGTALAQQPFQMPTSLGAVVNGSVIVEPPMQAVGGSAMARRSVSGTSQLGIYSTDAGPASYVTFVSGARAAAIDDARAERSVNTVTRIFCTEPSGAGRVLNQLTSTGTTTLTALPTLPASNWRLGAVSRSNSRFILFDQASGNVARFDATLFPAFQVLTTMPGAREFALSPNGLNLAMRIPGTTPFAPSTLLTTSATAPGAVTTLATSVQNSAPVWLDDQFIGIVELVGTDNTVRRFDRTNPAAVVSLTSGGVRLDPGAGMSISDDHEWLTFVTQNLINSSIERVPAAMRLTDGVSTGANGPGGSYVELGNYRWGTSLPASMNLTNWYNIVRPVVAVSTAGAQRSVRVIWHGVEVFGNPQQVMRADVRDDPIVVPRGVMGTTVAVTCDTPPSGSLWGMTISFQRTDMQTSLVPNAENAFLLVNPATLFFATPTGPTMSVPITLPSAPALSGIRMMFQGAWLTTTSNTPFFTHVAEYSIF